MKFRTSSPSLDRYLDEIGQIPLITREEETRLAVRCQASDRAAEEELVEANLRFVVSVAKTYRWSDVPLEDLINTGNHGLLEAVRNYKPERGARLISYAVWFIRRNILIEIAKFQNIIASTKDRQMELLSIRRALETASVGHEGKPLTPEQLRELGISEVQLTEAKVASTHQSLDADFKGSDASLLDMLEDKGGVSPDAFVKHEHYIRTIAQLIEPLTEEEASVIRMMCRLEDGESHSVSETAAMLNLTAMVVENRYSKAMRKMRIAAKAMLTEKGETFFGN